MDFMTALSADAMTFHNRLRIMLNIETFDLASAGITDQATIRKFMADPFQTFIRADDETCAKLWSLVEARSRRPIRTQVRP